MTPARRSIPQGIELLSLLVAALVVILIAGLSARAWIVFGQRSDQLAVSQEVSNSTVDLLSKLKDAETGQRGFLLTGRERYLEPYQKALADVPAALNRLALATAQRPDQSRRVEALGHLVAEKLGELEQTVDLRQTQGPDAALAIVLSDRGKAVMDEIRRRCAEIRNVAYGRFAGQSMDARAAADQLGLLSTLGSVVLFSLLVLGIVSIQKGTRRRQHLIQDLHRSHQQTAEARDWLQTTLTSIGDGVIAANATGNITFLNEVAQSLTGWTQEQAAGRPVEEVFAIRNEETGAIAENPVGKALLEGRIVGLANHTKLISKDGRQFSIDDSAAPIRDANGQMAGVVLVFRDVTERKQIDNELRQAERRFHTAVSAVSDILWTNNAEGKMEGEQPGWENFTGQSFAEYQEYGWSAAVHPDDTQPTLNEWKRAVSERRKFVFEHRVRRSDGVWRLCSVTAMPVIGTAGEIQEWVGVHSDITDMRASVERLRALLDANPIGVLASHVDGSVYEANDASLSIIGHTRDDLRSGLVNWKTITPAEFLPLDDCAIAEARVKGSCTPFEKEYFRKDGTRVSVYVGFALLGETRDELVKFIMDLTARKQAEQAVREAEERLRLALAAANIGTWEFDPATGKLQWDARCKLMFGVARNVRADDIALDRGQVDYERFLSLLHPEDRELTRELVQKATSPAGSGEFKADYRILLPDGATRWLVATGKYFFEGTGEDRKAVRFIGTVIDVTDVRNADYRLRCMIDSMDQLAWIADAEGRNVWNNKRWYEYTGTTAERMEGWGWESVHDPAVLSEVVEKWTESIRTGRSFEMVFPLKGADGVFRSFLTRANPLRNSDGKIVEWFGTNTDVDALQRAEAELKASEERFRHLAESMPQVVWTATPDGVCDYINPQWTELTGCDLAATQAGVFRHRMLPEDVEAMDQAEGEGRRLNAPYSVECRFRRASDGTLRWYLVRAVPARRAAGEIVKWFGTSTDIDEQKRTEEALRRANQDLESFAYSASHDLQEPLRMITSFSQLLVKGYRGHLDGDAEICVNFITEGTRRMRNLLADLLAYTQVDRDSADGAEAVDLNIIFQQALRNCKSAIEESKAVVTCERLPVVYGYEPHFLQLLQNLIGNAIKYRGESVPRVRVSAAHVDGTWRLAVSDNGIGIAPEYHERIFGVFRRLHGKEIPGTGIGLAICQRVVSRYGGRIWVESQLNRGTTFYCTLPTVKGAAYER